MDSPNKEKQLLGTWPNENKCAPSEFNLFVIWGVLNIQGVSNKEAILFTRIPIFVIQGGKF